MSNDSDVTKSLLFVESHSIPGIHVEYRYLILLQYLSGSAETEDHVRRRKIKLQDYNNYLSSGSSLHRIKIIFKLKKKLKARSIDIIEYRVFTWYTQVIPI